MTPASPAHVNQLRVEAAKQAFVDAIAARIVAGYLQELAQANQQDSARRRNHPQLPAARSAA